MYRIRMKRTRDVLRAAVLEAVAQDLTIEDTDEVTAIVLSKLAPLSDYRSTDAARTSAVETVSCRLHEINKVAAAAVRRAVKDGLVLDEGTAPTIIGEEAERDEVELDEELQRAAEARALRLYRHELERNRPRR